MFELEKRIWAGIVDLKIILDHHIPFVDTWYDKNKVDNYTEQLYADYLKEKVGYNTANYYDVTDDKTPNYSPQLTFNGKQILTLERCVHIYPWYMYTSTPWHMLGYSLKP